MKIFVSATTGQFKACRDAIASDLRAVGHEVTVQEDFQQKPGTLLEKLQHYIASCDRVVLLIGSRYGSGPEPDASFPGRPRRSYTQWEYYFAIGERLDGTNAGRKDLYVYFASEEYRLSHPVDQSAEDEESQRQFEAAIRRSGKDWQSFSSLHELGRLLLRDLTEATRARKPNNLPFPTLGRLFKGREEFIKQLQTTFSSEESHGRVAAITSAVATVHGLGGVGKTRAAIEFAHRYATEFTAVLFVPADSPESLKTNLAALCGPLVLDLAEKNATDMDVRVTAALKWLQEHPGWFLILDNVDSKEAATEVIALLGRIAGYGRALITSRLSRWPAVVESLSLDVLTEEAAADFLLERTARDRRKLPDDKAQARTLAVMLGQLALALEQAGAMIGANSFTFGQYIGEWHSRHDHVLSWFDEHVMQYPRSVAVTWQTSFDQLRPPARQLLNLLAWFAPDPVPESLLDVPIAATVPSDGDGLSASRDALAELKRYSLVTRETEAPKFSVHRLVQDVTRRSLRDDAEHHALIAALNWVDDAFVGDPQDVRTWPTLEPLAPHAHTIAQYADRAAIAIPTSRLFDGLGLLYHCRARYAESEPLMRRALAIDEASYGPEHPKLAVRLNNLATLLQDTDRLSEAEPLMRRALAMDEASYGPGHPNVASDLNNLAQLLQATNRLVEAEPLMRRALAIDEASYGPEHPDVARDLNNLARLLQDMNRLSEAEPLMRRALAIFVQFMRAVGHRHPHLEAVVDNYRGLLMEMGRTSEEAVNALREIAPELFEAADDDTGDVK